MDYQIIPPKPEDITIVVDGKEYGLVPKPSPAKEPERDWEIMSGKSGSGEIHEWIKKSTGNTCEQMGCDIYSVKRLSDGVVFSVGDELKDGKIKSFRIVNGHLCIDCVSKDRLTINPISKLSKLPERTKLFTTEDGTDVFNPDSEIYYISGFKIISKKAKNAIYLDNKKFYLPENAQEYVLMNKPTLSVNDILKLDLHWGNKDVFHVYKDKLIELAKSKL